MKREMQSSGKISVLLLTAAILLSISIPGFGETIKVGFFDLEPYVIKQADGKFTGAAIEFFEQTIAPKMDVKVEWTGPFPITRANQMLETGDIDAMLIAARNPEREKKFLFPAKGYILMKPCLTVLKTSPITKVSKQEDLFNLKLGFQEGAIYNPFIKSEKIKLDQTTGLLWRKNNLDKLLLGRIDAMYDNNDIASIYEAKRSGNQGKVRNVLLPVDPTVIYTIFAKNDKGQKLLKAYNAANEGETSETFDTILTKYK